MALIRLSKSSIGNEELRNVNKVLKNEFLGMGSELNLSLIKIVIRQNKAYNMFLNGFSLSI